MQNLAVFAYSEYKDPGVDVAGLVRQGLGGGAHPDPDRDDPQPARSFDLSALRNGGFPLANIETANAQGQEEDARDSR